MGRASGVHWKKLCFVAVFMLVISVVSILDYRLPNRSFIPGAIRKWITNANVTEPPKIVLAWTTFWDDPFRVSFDDCAESNCKLVTDQNLVPYADAVIFHITRNDFAYWNALFFNEHVPPVRYPHQRYIFLNHESPLRQTGYVIGQLQKRPNFINWTMTYRVDSDVFMPYVSIAESPTARLAPLNRSQVLHMKHPGKKVIWFSSHCPTKSRREDYVHELEKFITVDIYGACGKFTCPKIKHGSECMDKIQEYKFYLAFENAVCKDYITEKLWDRYKYATIPIVLKRSIYEKHFPNDAFIAADDFRTAKQLADYLKYLDANNTAYLQYFEYRLRPRFLLSSQNGGHDYFGKASGFCLLCQMLHQDLPQKSYSNLVDWWIKDAQCDTKLVPQFIQQSHEHV